MRKILTTAIQGTEVLARDIFTSSDTILMSAGTRLKKEYITRLKDLNIHYIYVEDDLTVGINKNEMIEIQIKESYQKNVKKVLERYLYTGNSELENIKSVAEEIIYNLLKKPEIMFNISGVRQNSEQTYSHSICVCVLSVFIALKMKISHKKIEEIAIGSLLHDIGFSYISLSNGIIEYSKLSEKELKEIKKHVIFGYSSVEKENWLNTLSKEIILYHHETLNGTGYPMKLKGDRIKKGVKIVAVCDIFDRLVYGYFIKPMKVHAAIEYIVSQSGILFDEEVVKVFYESVAAYPNGSLVLTEDGETGIVLRQNHMFPTRPVIRMLKKKDGTKYEKWIEKDLVKELNIFIQDTVETL